MRYAYVMINKNTNEILGVASSIKAVTVMLNNNLKDQFSVESLYDIEKFLRQHGKIKIKWGTITVQVEQHKPDVWFR